MIMEKKPYFGMAEFFDRFSSTYDLQERWRYMWYKWLVNKIIENVRSVKGNARILDLCSGTGFVAFKLAERFPQSFVVGLDVSKGMTSQAMKKNKSKNVNFVICPAEYIPFKENTFDFIVSNLGVSHASDIGHVLRLSFEVLKKNGKIIYSAVFEPDKEYEGVVMNLRSKNPKETKAWDSDWEKSIKKVEDVSGEEYYKEHPLTPRKPHRKDFLTDMKKVGFKDTELIPCYSKIFGIFKGIKTYK